MPSGGHRGGDSRGGTCVHSHISEPSRRWSGIQWAPRTRWAWFFSHFTHGHISCTVTASKARTLSVSLSSSTCWHRAEHPGEEAAIWQHVVRDEHHAICPLHVFPDPIDPTEDFIFEHSHLVLSRKVLFSPCTPLLLLSAAYLRAEGTWLGNSNSLILSIYRGGNGGGMWPWPGQALTVHPGHGRGQGPEVQLEWGGLCHALCLHSEQMSEGAWLPASKVEEAVVLEWSSKSLKLELYNLKKKKKKEFQKGTVSLQYL